MNELEVRRKYFEAIGNERKVEILLKQLQEIHNPSALLLAYRAACESMMAQFSWNLYTKLAQVNKSFDLFAEAIKKDSQNAEIRSFHVPTLFLMCKEVFVIVLWLKYH